MSFTISNPTKQRGTWRINILSWCWWNFLTSANQITQIGSCDRSRIHVPDLGGTGVWPGKNGFHRKCKNLDNIAVHLIASLKSKWKNKQIKIWITGCGNGLLIYVLEGDLQWNSWIFKMIDYLEGSIVKFKLNFEKALENKCKSVWWWQISSKTLMCLGWGNLSIVNHLYFQNIILSKHFD